MRQFVITPAAGKRLIAKGLLGHPAIEAVLRQGTLVIVAGSTNGYVAEEILTASGQFEGFSRRGFRRGLVLPPGFDSAAVTAPMPKDVVLVNGVWERGRSIFDVADALKPGDVVLKGGNAVDVACGQAAVLVGDAQVGTTGPILRAVYGRRVRLIVPIGLEKRVVDDLTDLAAEMNSQEMEGPRLLPLPGTVFTELDAIKLLTGATARLVSGGGVYGAEGSVWVSVAGSVEQIAQAQTLIASVAAEPLCQA